MLQIEEQLEQLEQAIQFDTGQEQPPKTAFDVLGQQQSEGAWQAYLGYFLNPNKSHGLQHEFLHEFLSGLQQIDAIPFDVSEFELRSDDSLEVELERSTPSGIPDIVVYSKESWFLCMELKVYASEINEDETWQTERYASEPKVAPPSIDAYEERGYVYLKPDDAPDSKSATFTDVTWEEIVPILRNFIGNNAGRVPTRTLNQLVEFADHIENELNMTEIDETTRKRKDLYFEYRDAIQKAEESIEPFVENVLQQRWAEALESEHKPDTATEVVWLVDHVGNSWGKIYAESWVDAGMSDFAFDLHFEHKPSKKYFKQGRLKYLLELEEPNRSTITPNEGDRYDTFRKDILSILPDTIDRLEDTANWEVLSINPGRSQKKLFRAEYKFSPGDENEYYAALKQAVDDCAPVAEEITKILQSTDYTRYPRE